MWASTVGLINGKHRYLTAETFGFKVNSNGQLLKKRQQWTIEPFPEITGPDGSVSSAASISSQCTNGNGLVAPLLAGDQLTAANNESGCSILTFGTINKMLTANDSDSLSSQDQASENSSSSSSACAEEHENIAIKSHLNKYLAVDSFGNVTCDLEEKNENARFQITICSMSQGKSKDEHIFWAFKNVERGYYLGTTEDGMICCNAKMPKSRAELWHLHLIPARGSSFFSLKSIGRKRFARLATADDDAGSQIQLDATISWASETLFQFKYFSGGRYALLTSDNCLYLTNEGKCISWRESGSGKANLTDAEVAQLSPDAEELPPKECLFTLEYHSGFLAFRDSFSHYLAATGRSSVLKSRSIGVSRDELFLFDPAPVQVSLKATFNNRWVSIKQGVDLSANQTETSKKFETFQLTYHKQTQLWSIMTYDCNFWTLSQNNTSTISVCKPGDYEGLNRGSFKLVWSESDATCSLKYIEPSSSLNKQQKPDGRWILARKSGQLYLASQPAAGSQPVKFIMRIQNRRLLNLRPVDGTGFVGLKSKNCKQLEANKTSPDSIVIEYYCEPTGNGTANQSKFLLSNGQSGAIKSSPQVPEKPFKSQDSSNRSQEQPTINMFNVKLNSTKAGGQSVLDRFNGVQANIIDNGQAERISSSSSNGKEVDFGIDENNNCVVDAYSKQEEASSEPNGSVESTAAPSVASIINSFSAAKVSACNTNRPAQLSSKELSSTSVTRLASSFDNGNIHMTTAGNTTATFQLDGSGSSASDAASVISSCSSTTASARASHKQMTSNSDQLQPATIGDQLAQFECCYLKLLANDKYLVVANNKRHSASIANDGANGSNPAASVATTMGDTVNSILCDATNKACAQSWILELRSHNSIAIRASDIHAYVQLGTNGTIALARCEPSEASLWEF